MHAGMSWERLEELGGLQWPCPDEEHPGTQFLHARLWADDPAEQGPKAPFSVVIDDPPVDQLDAEFPFRLTTGRRLDSYNTGVQTGGYTSPLRRGETIDMSPEDVERMRFSEGERVLISSRRGSVEAPVHVDPGLRPGLVFMTMHFPDEVDTNVLTIEATDPKSGTAEFKATAVRIEKLPEETLAETADGGGVVDLHLSSAAPTDEERAAVDALLGPPSPGGTGPDATPTRIESRAGAARRAIDGTSSCPRCMRCRGARDGSARAASTTSAGGSPCRRPRRTAWRRSTRCSARSPARAP